MGYRSAIDADNLPVADSSYLMLVDVLLLLRGRRPTHINPFGYTIAIHETYPTWLCKSLDVLGVRLHPHTQFTWLNVAQQVVLVRSVPRACALPILTYHHHASPIPTFIHLYYNAVLLYTRLGRALPHIAHVRPVVSNLLAVKQDILLQVEEFVAYLFHITRDRAMLEGLVQVVNGGANNWRQVKLRTVRVSASAGRCWRHYWLASLRRRRGLDLIVFMVLWL